MVSTSSISDNRQQPLGLQCFAHDWVFWNIIWMLMGPSNFLFFNDATKSTIWNLNITFFTNINFFVNSFLTCSIFLFSLVWSFNVDTFGLSLLMLLLILCLKWFYLTEHLLLSSNFLFKKRNFACLLLLFFESMRMGCSIPFRGFYKKPSIPRLKLDTTYIW